MPEPSRPASPSPWLEVLDFLEADARGEGTTRAEPWLPPTGLGPLPPELAERARAVLAAQRRRAAKLEQQRTSVAAELAVVRAVPTGERASAYLDVTG